MFYINIDALFNNMELLQIYGVLYGCLDPKIRSNVKFIIIGFFVRFCGLCVSFVLYRSTLGYVLTLYK